MQGTRAWIGGIEYTKNMILALSSLAHEVRSSIELSLLSLESIERHLYDGVIPHVDHLYFMEKIPTPSIVHWVYRTFKVFLSGSYNSWYDAFFKDKGFDFVYPFTFNQHIETPYRYASWIADFQHKHMPHYFSEADIRKRDTQFEQIVTYAPIIVLSSKTAESDFRTFFPRYAHKTRVLSFRTSPDPDWYVPDPIETQIKYSLPDKFFIVCNQFWKHKNHLTLFTALHLMRKKGLRPVLVCTGSIEDHRDRVYMNHIQKTIDELGIRDQIHILGLIPRLDQIQLMRRAIAVIQPSLFEGWSTVVEDSRCLGKPIILSNIPVHEEQNPERGIFFEKESPEELADHMEKAWMILSAGPLLSDESHARELSIQAVTEYGYRILDLAGGKSS